MSNDAITQALPATREQPTPPTEGRPVCDARAASCRCMKDAGHVEAGDTVHSCDPGRCTGAWSGEFCTETFAVVQFPLPVGQPRPWDTE